MRLLPPDFFIRQQQGATEKSTVVGHRKGSGIYRKDTEHLYNYLMYSLVSLFFPVHIGNKKDE